MSSDYLMKIFINILILFAFFSMSALLAELSHHYFWGNKGTPFREFREVISGDPRGKKLKGLGFIGSGHGQYRTVRTRGNEIIAQSLVTMNGPFRAVPGRPLKANINKNIIFYGGSYIFGLGINDEDTLPSLVQSNTPNLNIYSMSASGWGGQQLLWLIENDWIKKNVKNNSGGWVIYGLMPDHFRRLSNHPSVITYINFNPDTAFYRLASGTLSYQGTFRDNFPSYTFLLEKLHKTSIGNHLLYNMPSKIFSNGQDVFCALIKKSSKILKKKFNYNLAVFYFPNEYFNTNIDTCLRQNVLVLDYSHKLLDLKKNGQLSIHPEDSHPSRLQNEKLSDLIIEDLNLLNL